MPSLSADDATYKPNGNYWQGGVWAPATYMVLRGLNELGEDALAHEIAHNHHANVVEVYTKTGTLWENYAPESANPGDPAHPDFVGWAGLPAIAVLFEQVFGLRANVPEGKLVWDVRLLEEHGVERYPFGKDGLLNLRCAARRNLSDLPHVEVSSNVPVKLVVQWMDGTRQIDAQ